MSNSLVLSRIKPGQIILTGSFKTFVSYNNAYNEIKVIYIDNSNRFRAVQDLPATYLTRVAFIML